MATHAIVVAIGVLLTGEAGNGTGIEYRVELRVASAAVAALVHPAAQKVKDGLG